jgi:hypothetical protein
MNKHLPHFEAITSGRIRFSDGAGHVRAFTWQKRKATVKATVSGYGIERRSFTVSDLRFLYLHLFLTVGAWSTDWRLINPRSIPLYPMNRTLQGSSVA